eukprot:TRINITY_DN27740_c0_g1_i1.p3 TRINITY_DN27740_c0_g1~~TRINITY_DN27740_c0_g1_i1.p3  ORF type:complete len:53 (-),score=2.18 TRINITY_DN27740_c0_g1_i1:29-187(-)
MKFLKIGLREKKLIRLAKKNMNLEEKNLRKKGSLLASKSPTSTRGLTPCWEQ